MRLAGSGRFRFAICALIPVLLPSFAQDRATMSLVEAERAFAQDAQERLVNDAFLSVLADSGVLFRPAPVLARPALTQRPMRASLSLVWAPTYAETSADGLFGFDLGPYESGERGKPPAATGHFFSVWRRASVHEPWKLVTDCGIAGPIRVRPDSAGRALAMRSLRQPFAAGQSLEETERRLVADYRAGFPALADDDARVLRDGRLPTANQEAAITTIGRDADAEFEVSSVAVAGSGDLGYVVGVINPRAADPRGYQRLYRRSPDGKWKIAVDCRP